MKRLFSILLSLSLLAPLNADGPDKLWEASTITIEKPEAEGTKVDLAADIGPVINIANGKAYIASQSEISELVWALKAAWRDFRPEPKKPEGYSQAAIIFWDGAEENPNSPEGLRKQAKKLEEEALALEQKYKDKERFKQVATKWENIQKGLK